MRHTQIGLTGNQDVQVEELPIAVILEEDLLDYENCEQLDQYIPVEATPTTTITTTVTTPASSPASTKQTEAEI